MSNRPKESSMKLDTKLLGLVRCTIITCGIITACLLFTWTFQTPVVKYQSRSYVSTSTGWSTKYVNTSQGPREDRTMPSPTRVISLQTKVIPSPPSVVRPVMKGLDAAHIYSPWEIKRHQLFRANCPKLLANVSSEVKRITKLLSRYPYQQPDAKDIGRWASDCTNYRKYYAHRFKYVTQIEREFPIAFGIRMHRSVEQAEQLLRNIYTPQNIYCIYIDQKSSQEIHKAMASIANCFPNVFLASQVREFHYSTVTHIKADVRCMKDAINQSSSWTYYINLSGEEFPLKTNLGLVEILKGLRGQNGIKAKAMSKDLIIRRFLLPSRFYENRGLKNLPMRPRSSLPKIKYYKGTEYNFYTRNFIKWTFTNPTAKLLLRTFSNGSWASDETYWSSLSRLPEAPGKFDATLRHGPKAVFWKGNKKGVRCKRFVRLVCIYSVNELSYLLSRQNPFANKFFMNVDPIATDCLSEMLTEKLIHQRDV